MKKLIFNTDKGFIQTVSSDEEIAKNSIVLFDGNEILNELATKPVHEVVIEKIIQALKRIPHKKTKVTIPVDCIIDWGISFNPNELNTAVRVPDKSLVSKIKEFLLQKLVDSDLDVRSLNCLKAADIEYWFQVITYKRNDLIKFRNYGKKSIKKLEETFTEHGITVEKWDMIAELPTTITFDPESRPCSSIESIVQSEEWKRFCDIVSVVEDGNTMKARDFILISGSDYCQKTYSILKFDNEDNKYAKKITDTKKQKELTVVIEKIRELVSEFYMKEAKLFIESLPLE